MKIVEGRVRVAASDVANFLACQELTQLDLLGNGEFVPFKVKDFAAYERQTRVSQVTAR